MGGENYGQGSSREHAAIAPRYLGLQVVIALSIARIHMQNLVNFGILPLIILDKIDFNSIEQGNILEILDVRSVIQHGSQVQIINKTKGSSFLVAHQLSERQVKVMLAGRLINYYRETAFGER